MNKPLIATLLLTFGGLSASSALAGPVTTVPWNGHTGAVSYTYDDARVSQLPNLLPQLDSLKIKATFEIAAAVGNFTSRVADWILVSKNGHELANHTRNHINITDANSAATVKDFADYLRALDTSVQSVTFAYPNCSIPGTTGKNGVSAENFIGRGCGQTTYAWGTQPTDWMNIQGLILSPTNTNTSVTMQNTAKTSNAWFITIVHDVASPTPDQYSVTPANNLVMLNAGISNGLWIDTYLNVGAYYRAHFTMDTATAIQAPGTGIWNLAWTSPHPKMPKSVPLRVNLATTTFGSSFTVLQGNTVIAPELNGSYIIDFMKLSLKVSPGTSGVRARKFLPSELHAKLTPNGILFGGTIGTVEALVTDVGGRVLFRGKVSDRLVPLRRDQMRGILFLTVVNRTTGASVRTMVNAVR